MALSDMLVSYYSLDEASGNALDAHGSNDLTDNNTVGSAAGKVSNARLFTLTNGEYLSRADNTDLSGGDVDFEFACWVNLTTKPGNMAIAGKHNGASVAGSEWLLSYNVTADRFRLEAYQGAGNAASLDANNLGSPSTGTWYYVRIWHDATANQLGIQVNNGTANTTAWSFGVNDTATAFCLGATANAGSFLNGAIDEAAFWKRHKTNDEHLDLWNSGNGRGYAYIATPPPTSGAARRRRLLCGRS